MPGRLFTYVLRRTATALLVAFLVVTSIIMLVDFVEANRDLGSDTAITPFQLLALTAMKTPSLIEQTIPFVVLFGMMGAINGMNRRSELIVMRASGESAWSIIRPALWLAAGLGVLWAVVLNPVAAKLYDTFEDRSAQWLGAGPQLFEQDVWLREGGADRQVVVRAGRMELDTRTLEDVTIVVLDVDASDGRTIFTRRFDAAQAQLVTQGFWQLTDVVENAPNEETRRHDALSLPTTIDARQLAEQADGERAQAFWTLPRTIAENERAGFSARGLRLQFNRLLSLPVMLIAMTFIAAGVSMSLTREGGTLRLLITGAALGFAVFFSDNMVSAFGEVAVIPVYIAAWAVPLIVLLLGVSYLAKIEDG